MKKLIRLLAVALAVMMLAGCSLVTVNEEKIVVATVGDETITKAEFNEGFNALLSQYGYTQDSEEIADQLKTLKENYIAQMVEDKVLERKIKELGLDQVTDEEKAAAEQEIQDWYDEQYAALVENFKTDDTVEDPEAKAAETIENYLSQYGLTLDQMKENSVASISSDKLYDYVTKDVTVTEEEAKIEFANKVAAAKEKYDADLSAYVSDFENGATIYYTPKGCYYIKHILISLTDEQKQDIKNLRADDDETVAATADEKREEYLLTIREKAESVLKLVDEGGDFEALMEEYGEDPGMKNEAYKNGYLTYAGDTGFVTEFADACAALTEDGMTSGLVASDFGYHIIRRVSTVPSGEATFEDVKDSLMESMLTDKKSTTYDQQVEAWVKEVNPDIKTDKL